MLDSHYVYSFEQFFAGGYSAMFIVNRISIIHFAEGLNLLFGNASSRKMLQKCFRNKELLAKSVENSDLNPIYDINDQLHVV